MFLIDNVEQFFTDHPEHAAHREAVLAQAEEYTLPNGFIAGGMIQDIFGPLADEFTADMQGQAHVAIFDRATKALLRRDTS